MKLTTPVTNALREGTKWFALRTSREEARVVDPNRTRCVWRDRQNV
jgi:hypothetical protein